MTADPHAWPELPVAAMRPTLDTLHLMTQVVGKVRLAKTPWVNHSWHVTLYVSARGLTTSLIPNAGRPFELEFDLLSEALVARCADGGERRVALRPQSLAAFHASLMAALADLDLQVRIDETPNELPDPTPFPQDVAPRVYDGEHARAWWRALTQADRVFQLFRTRFVGKCSPVHLFWGSFDLAVTRFSGRAAPPHPGGMPHLPDVVAREAYSHEVSSAGFWPGTGAEGAMFYSYAYPAPAGFAQAALQPSQARFDPALGEFLLPYDAVRAASDPDAALLAFLQSTFVAAADLAHWDRAALEAPPGEPRRPRPLT